MRPPSLYLGALLGVFGAVAAQPAAAAPTSTAVPGISAPGDAISRAADGSMWLTEPTGPGRIARIASGGAVTEYTGGITPNFPSGRSPEGIAITPDGYAWFLMDGGSDELGRISLSTGLIDRFTMNLGTPTSLAAGSDGKLWMTGEGFLALTDFIARYDANTGSTDSYSSGMYALTDPRSIMKGPDGALRFVEGNGGRVGRITTGGAITFRSIGGAPNSLAIGPSGSLWFSRGQGLGLINADAAPVVPTVGTPTAVAAGPDDAVWGAATGGIVRVGPDGQVSTFPAGIPAAAHGVGLAAGPDGRMWMTLDRAPYLVRITVPPRTGTITARATSATTATVTANIRANGIATTAALQRSHAGSSWTTIATSPVGTSANETQVHLEAENLASASSHSLRVVATNDAGVALSAEVQVQTGTPEPEPTTPAPTTPEPTTPEPTTPEPTTPEPTTPEVEPTTPEPTTPEVEPTTPEPTTPEVEPTTPEPTTPEVEPTTPQIVPVTPEPTPEPTTPEVEPTVPEVEPTLPEVEPTVEDPEPTAPEADVTPTTPDPIIPIPIFVLSVPPPAEAAPVQGETVVVRPASGTVQYRVPGSTEVLEADGSASIPNGSTIDTTKGEVVLSSQVGDAAQEGRFSGGIFKVKQVKATGMTQLYLKDPLDCSASGAKATKSAAKKKRRHVWGQDKNGRFETHGKDSVATVRGTKWLTTDTCAGTVVKVFEGSVSVKPTTGKGKAVIVRPGERHFTPHAR